MNTLFARFYLCFGLLLIITPITSIKLNAKEITIQYNNAYVLYQEGDYTNSINKLKEILNDTLYFFNNEFTKERVYNLLGVNYMFVGDYKNSLIHYKKAIDLLKTNSNKNILPVIYINLANLYSIIGESTVAIEYYNQALISLSKQNNEYLKLYYFILNNLGIEYYNIENYSTSISYYQKASEFGEKNYLNGLEDTYQNYALTFQKLNENDSTSKYFKKSIDLLKLKLDKNDIILAKFYLNYGKFLIETGSFTEGLNYYKNSYDIYKNKVGENHPAIAELFSYYGEYYIKTRQFDSALIYFQKSLVAKLPAFNNTSYFSNPLPENIVEDIQVLDVLKNKANALSLLANEKNDFKLLKLAVETYQLSISTIDNLRAGYLSEKSRLDLNNRERETYAALVDNCYHYYNITGHNAYKELAFTYCEKSKYANLHQSISENQAMYTGGIPAEIIQNELSLREKIGAYRKQLLDISMEEKPDSGLMQKINNRLFDALRERETLLGNIEKDYPRYYQVKYKSKEVSIRAVQKALGREDALIEYFFSGAVLYTFLVTRQHSEIYRQQTDTMFGYYSSHFIKALHSAYEYDYKLYRQSAYYLYNKLVNSLYPAIKGKNLVIVPDGAISYFSFDAMVTQPYKNEGFVDYKRYPYLLYDHSISYAFSASLLEGNKTNKKSWKSSFVGFAPDYNGHKDSLLALPGIGAAMKKYSEWTGGRIFTGRQATETAFNNYAPGNDIILIITHGQSDTLNPANSRMFFDYRGDTINDGYLYLYEVYNLDLMSRLIMAPSCYSGYGKLNVGEGLESFAQGFQRSGNCPSTLISMWEADLGVTTTVFDRFFKLLFHGGQMDVSLQKAKIKYLEDTGPLFARPYYWSNLVIIGNHGRLYYNKMFIILFGVFVIAVVIIMIILIFSKAYAPVRNY